MSAFAPHQRDGSHGSVCSAFGSGTVFSLAVAEVERRGVHQRGRRLTGISSALEQKALRASLAGP